MGFSLRRAVSSAAHAASAPVRNVATHVASSARKAAVQATHAALLPLRQAQRLDNKLSRMPGTKLLHSIATAPVRQVNNARLAALQGRSVSSAFNKTRIGNTTALKVARVSGAVAATYLTAGAAGAYLGVAGAGSAAAGAMGLTAAGQLASQGYLSERGLVQSGLKGGAGAIAGKVPGYDTYAKLRSLKDRRDKYQEKQRQRALDQADQAEVAKLEAEIQAETNRVAQQTEAGRGGRGYADARPEPRNPIADLVGWLRKFQG